MSEFEMEAIDQQVENLANSKHEEACENPAPETEGKPGFWQQLDNEIHYTSYRRKRQIVAVLWVLACLAAAAALVDDGAFFADQRSLGRCCTGSGIGAWLRNGCAWEAVLCAD